MVQVKKKKSHLWFKGAVWNVFLFLEESFVCIFKVVQMSQRVSLKWHYVTFERRDTIRSFATMLTFILGKLNILWLL